MDPDANPCVAEGSGPDANTQRKQNGVPTPKVSRGGLDIASTAKSSFHVVRFYDKARKMTKTELQIALAQATQTDKKTAGVFLDALGTLAYKETKKNGEFVLPGFGKLVKQKRKARMGFNPKTQEKIRIPAKTVVKFRVAKAAKDAVLWVKK
jgi:DNA-binding protein HU-beta